MRAGNRVVLRWGRPGSRRCGWCGRAVPAFAEAGHGPGRVYCESCFLNRERWRAAVWALRLAQGAITTGAA